MDRFADLGAMVDYHDPYVPKIGLTREHARWLDHESVEWNENAVRSYDVVVVATKHSCFDLESLAEWSPLVIDTRGSMQSTTAGGVVVKA